MGGIHREKIQQFLKLDIEGFKVIMGFAIGKLDIERNFGDESKEALRPSSRLDLKYIWNDMD
jgi:hypothetical protein